MFDIRRCILSFVTLTSLSACSFASTANDPLRLTIAEKETAYTDYCKTVKKSSDATCACGLRFSKEIAKDRYQDFMTFIILGLYARTGKITAEIAREKIKAMDITSDDKLLEYANIGSDISIASIKNCSNL